MNNILPLLATLLIGIALGRYWEWKIQERIEESMSDLE